MNGILEDVEARVKREFATGVLGVIDALTAPVDDRLAMWSVRAARDAAWTNAQVIWALGSQSPLARSYFDRLDRFTGFAAQGMLVPLAALRPSR